MSVNLKLPLEKFHPETTLFVSRDHRERIVVSEFPRRICNKKTQEKRKFDDDIYPSVRTPRNSPPCDLFRINIISLRILSPKFFRGKEENFCITHLAIVPHPPSIREDPYLPGSARIKRGNGPTDLTPRYNLKDRGKSIYAVSIRKITKVSIRWVFVYHSTTIQFDFLLLEFTVLRF